MPSNKDKTSSRAQPRRTKADEEAEEARLDALIAAPAKASARPAKSVLASKLDKPRTEQKSVMPSKLDRARTEPKSVMASKLDKSVAEKSKIASKLDNSRVEKSKLASRLDQAEMEGLASRLNKTSLRTEYPATTQSSVKTAFTNPQDIEMATRQTMYDSLPPQEKLKQEEWAQQKIREVSICPAGFVWIRVPGGYNCDAGGHWMSDELVAAGKGGWYGRDYTVAERNANFQGMMTGIRGFSMADRIKWRHSGMREIGFSKGLDGFHGPHYGFLPSHGNRFQNHRQPHGLNGLINPGPQSPYQQQYLSDRFNPYGNNHDPFGFTGNPRFQR